MIRCETFRLKYCGIHHERLTVGTGQAQRKFDGVRPDAPERAAERAEPRRGQAIRQRWLTRPGAGAQPSFRAYADAEQSPTERAKGVERPWTAPELKTGRVQARGDLPAPINAGAEVFQQPLALAKGDEAAAR